MKKKAPQECRASGNNNSQPNSNITGSQKERLLQTLKKHPVSTTYARSDLDIMHPAARILELRATGLKIFTDRKAIETLDGNFHHVAVYIIC